MKMVMVVYDAAHDEAVLAALEKCQTPGFTQWQRVLGRGQRSAPKMDDSVWPGYNHVLMTAVSEGPCLEATVAALSRLHGDLGGKGLKVFSWPLETVI
jgi:nitrogen regulatory protein PII